MNDNGAAETLRGLAGLAQGVLPGYGRNGELLLGKLPDGLIVEIPIPTRSRLLGSLYRLGRVYLPVSARLDAGTTASVERAGSSRLRDGVRWLTALFDTPMPPREVMDFYAKRWTACELGVRVV
jgi:hypothetical protein